MTAMHEDTSGSGWRKLAALLLCIVAVGLPVNTISDYALLVVLAVVIFTGVRARVRSRLAGRNCDRHCWRTGTSAAVAAAHSGRAQCVFAGPRARA